MTLEKLLKAMTNKDMFVSVTDVEGDEIIKFVQSGYEGVESDLLAREVKKFTINGSQNITVVVKDAGNTATGEVSGQSITDVDADI